MRHNVTMGLTSRHSLLKGLLATLPHGQPFGLPELASKGVSAHLAAKYVRSGWLERLAQGIYAFPNDHLQRDACLRCLQNQVEGFHVGGKTALDFLGLRHNVSSRPLLHLWGTQRYTLPRWFTSRYPAVDLQRKLTHFTA